MHTHSKYTTLLRASALGIALAATPALAQSTNATNASTASTTGVAGTAAPAQPQSGTPGATPDGQTTASTTTTASTATTSEATENQVSTPAVSPGTRALARWVRAIGGRISIGPRVNRQATVSHPDLAFTNHNRRIWVPSFTHARLVGPPSRSPRPTAIAPKAESATGDPAQTHAGKVTADAPSE